MEFRDWWVKGECSREEYKENCYGGVRHNVEVWRRGTMVGGLFNMKRQCLVGV